jgi:hypothetical protein
VILAKNPNYTFLGNSSGLQRNGWTHFVCKGGTFPAQLMYQELADIACERITAAITRSTVGKSPIKTIPDPYNPMGSTSHVKFNTSRTDRWETDARRCHINWVILDSDWEAEFCRVAESHPRVKAYVKNHNLGFEVPYRFGSENRKYRPDFIVLVNDGHGEDDPLHLVVEIKGYRREDAKEKKSTMETYWVPGVNNSGKYGRWAFTEFTEVYQIESDFKARIESQFHIMIEAYSDAWTSDLRRANEYIASQLGQDGKWARLNDAIWARVRSAEDHAFQLSDLDAVSESVSCSGDEILAVLALLSRKSTGLLKMEFRSESLGGVEILPSEFTRMLTGWWRTKSISENEWREWASSVHVRWVLLGKEGLL